jgi:hypothetical protein
MYEYTFCYHCGNYHGPACPRIRAIEYYPNGTVKRVEYHVQLAQPQTVDEWRWEAENKRSLILE